MRCLYHNDLDGETSAAIVADATGCTEFIPVNHSSPFPIDQINGGHIYIVDCAPPTAELWREFLDNCDRPVWIDHHEGNIDKATEWGFGETPGFRHRRGRAACELTWLYFNKDRPIPMGISLIGDVDTYELVYGDRSMRFHQGLSVGYDTRPKEGWHDTWAHLFGDGETKPEFIKEVCELGRRVEAKRAITNPLHLRDLGFVVEFEGMIGVCINRSHAGAPFFKSVADQFDFLSTVLYNGEGWSVTMYHSPANTDVHLGRIAQKYGGNGHAGAAGFQCDELPFSVIRRLCDG